MCHDGDSGKVLDQFFFATSWGVGRSSFAQQPRPAMHSHPQLQTHSRRSPSASGRQVPWLSVKDKKKALSEMFRPTPPHMPSHMWTGRTKSGALGLVSYCLANSPMMTRALWLPVAQSCFGAVRDLFPAGIFQTLHITSQFFLLYQVCDEISARIVPVSSIYTLRGRFLVVWVCDLLVFASTWCFSAS